MNLIFHFKKIASNSDKYGMIQQKREIQRYEAGAKDGAKLVNEFKGAGRSQDLAWHFR